MLQLLKVFNFALIEQAEIEFDNGFNVLTGETGAGKSMVVDALNVVLGGRSSVEMLRSGCEQFRIDAVFALQAHEPLRALLEEQAIPQEEDGLLFLSRSVSRQGKNTVLVNGTPAPLSSTSSSINPDMDASALASGGNFAEMLRAADMASLSCAIFALRTFTSCNCDFNWSSSRLARVLCTDISAVSISKPEMSWIWMLDEMLLV